METAPGWVGPRVALDDLEKGKIFVTVVTELFQLLLINKLREFIFVCIMECLLHIAHHDKININCVMKIWVISFTATVVFDA